MTKIASQDFEGFVSKPLFDEKVILNKDSSWPKISIVTPSYNQAEFLERTILSVLGQNYPELEYIIIDGGSTDGSVDIIKKYEKYLTYCVSEPDKGQADALNKGFRKSTGEILGWINSDDMYLPRTFWKIAEAFKKYPDAAIVYGDYIKVNDEDRCIALRRQPSFDYRICLYAYLTVMQPASFFQRKAFFDVGGLDSSLNYSLDYDLILRLAKRGKMKHIKEYLAAFRLHPSSKSVAGKLRFSEEDRKVRLKNIGRQPLPGELYSLHWYYKARVFFRMLFEGCLPSRFGRDKGEYKLNDTYTSKMLEF